MYMLNTYIHNGIPNYVYGLQNLKGWWLQQATLISPGVLTFILLYRYYPFIHRQMFSKWPFFFERCFSLCFRLTQLPLDHLWQLYVLLHWPQLQLIRWFSTSMHLAVASVQHDVVLPPPLILRHTIRGDIGLAFVPQKHPQFQMPSQAYANYAMSPAQVSCFFFNVECPTDFLILVYVTVLTFCFPVPLWLPCAPMGTQPLGFVPLQSCGAYPWQAYMSPGTGLWSIPRVHWVAVPFTALCKVEPLATHLSCNHLMNIVGNISLGTCVLEHNRLANM